MFIQLALVLFVIGRSNGVSSPISPFTTYEHTVELQQNVSDFWWTVNETNQTILFELHIKTTGWIALGISPAGGMTGADIVVGWVEQSGTLRFLDEYATTFALPLLDNTTNCFALQGKEQNGWTAIQFTRALDTCDSMDVAIESGTNHLIFAYGLVDPPWNTTSNPITYHGNRRGSYSLSLRSYSDPPLESKFTGLNYFDFRINNYTIPAQDTTYYCAVFKAPSNYTTKQHVIANKILLNSTDISKVHHLLMYECDSTVKLNDSNLPSDRCENIQNQIGSCLSNIATGWAVGGDVMSEFPSDAGYPIGGNTTVKYYVLQMHYANSALCTNCQDSSGIRFYVTDQLRQYDIGYLTFGTNTNALGLTIPPQVETFTVDTYCPASATSLFPASGITIINAFPHTHLQGKSIWTKIIRNKTAVGYLFDAEAYDFNYQFNNRLPTRITIYPGDEFSTRCVYNTMNKNTTTFGGERTVDEMCLHMFTYFPRMDNMSLCLSVIHPVSWMSFLGINTTFNKAAMAVQAIASNMTWTSNLTTEWQNFYDNATRITGYGRGASPQHVVVPSVSDYRDLEKVACIPRGDTNDTSDAARTNHLCLWHVLLIISTLVLSFLTKRNN